MKTHLNSLLIPLALMAGVHQAAAQLPVITSFNQNGVLVCSNLQPGSVASVQWASSPSGPWTNWASAAGLDTLTVRSNGTITVSVPMFYRVLGVAATNNAVPSLPQFSADGMALIPSGTFTMGDLLDGESDALPTNIYVSSFYMDTNLVSYAEWQGVYNYATSHGYVFDNYGMGKAPNHPVQTVDWYDCVKWCNARSEQAGLTPVYYSDAGFTQVFRTGGNYPVVYANWGANGYRLPTEAEWEKASRGGLSGQRFPSGETISESQANYNGDTNDYSYDLGPNGFNPIGNYPATSPGTTPVGSFPPNGYGLYDMAGNAVEWCWDYYGTPYGQPTNTDPKGPPTGGSRVARGGVWGNVAKYARCADRSYKNDPYQYDFGTSFRCARGVNSSLPTTTSDGMALIPAGTFQIGFSTGDNTNVYVSSFYMDTNLVRYSQWQAVYDYATNIGYSFDIAGSGQGANYPVGTVDWYDMVKWCNARSQQAGLTPVYYSDAGLSQLYMIGQLTNPFVNWAANGYRLPTEAEWEKAARGGLIGQLFPWGNTISESQANYGSNPSNAPCSGSGISYDLGPYCGYNTNYYGPSPVGSFAPNGYGLYDMAGNVLEWCWDWYAATPYPAGSPYLGGTNPRGPVGPVIINGLAGPSGYRVMRGGRFLDSADLATCGARFYGVFLQNSASYSVGFRCVRGF